MRKALLTAVALLLTAGVAAQKIDFNKGGRPESEGLEEGYMPWVVNETESATETFGGVTLTLSCDKSYAGETVMTNYWKQGVTNGAKLVGDAVIAYKDDHANITEGAVKFDVKIEGLSAGRHALQAFHNNIDGFDAPPIDVYVNGVRQLEGVAQSNRQTSASESGKSYVEFDVAGGDAVTVSYVTVPEAGVSYGTTTVTINALVFDEADNTKVALDPVPAKGDMHADADNGSTTLSWLPAATAVRHHVWLGTSAEGMTKVAVTTEPGFTATQLTTHSVYYWRVDEEDAAGNVSQGEQWSFRPRRLAFPGAQGHGRFAIGGRGGTVYHVTSLADDGSVGTFRYGIEQLSGPRTIVFDVAGEIYLQSRLTCSDKYVTIAGQTAPGHGIMFRGCPVGMASDGITRFIRNRRGHILNEDDANKGLDGLGMAGNDHSIMDHCSVSWTIDEGFSSRGAKNITLQRTMIAEALNIAGHPNYADGKAHGFAATIGAGQAEGTAGSFHHNLLAHNNGRNWSISGGLDGGGFYDGHHDVFNNVVYNWDGRTTDGGTHEMNFVGNYYKVGPADGTKTLFTAQLEGTGKGSQSYYVSGNIRDNLNGTLTQDAYNVTYKYSLSGGQQLDWEVFHDVPFGFFDPDGACESAEAAYRNTLSDVGCNQPFLDLHDQRMVSETLTRTYSTKGSRSSKKGMIDSEEDEGCEGFDLDKLGIVTAQRDAAWDTDGDGIPDWYEQLKGTDPSTPNNNDYHAYNGYTDLEDYLNWVAEPNFRIATGTEVSIDLKPYFAGYETFQVVDDAGAERPSNGFVWSYEGTSLIVQSAFPMLFPVSVTVKDAATGISMTRQFNFAVEDGASDGIRSVSSTPAADPAAPCYNMAGQRVAQPQRGVYIRGGKKFVVR